MVVQHSSLAVIRINVHVLNLISCAYITQIMGSQVDRHLTLKITILHELSIVANMWHLGPRFMLRGGFNVAA